jgi:Transposase IS66 family
VGWKLNESITSELIEDAEVLLVEARKKDSFKRLKPVFKIADYFIRGLSKKLRAEPNHAGIYDKRYVQKLQSKVFGKGQSESGKIANAGDSDTKALTLKEAQDQVSKTDTELKDLLGKRDALRMELKEYSKLIKKRRTIIRQKVKKEGKWRVDERLFHSPIFRNCKLGEIRKVGRDMLEQIFKKLTGFHRTNDRVRRMGLKMELEEVTYTVETVTDPETGRSVRASMDDVGPPNSNLAWSALSNVLKLHIEYVIPMNRIAAMLGHDYFSTANQCRWFSDTARDFLPVYLELFDQLADSPLWQGDDTTTKVLNTESSKQDEALHKQVEKELPFGFDLKNGKGKKSKLNVSFVTGRMGNDPRGVIRFYRTHLGSFGNLVSELLSRRSAKPQFKEVIIHGDLSTTNLPSSEYYEKFKIRIAGCGSHARRPFWDERSRIDATYFFLRGFQLLSHIEEDHGKNRFENPKALRKRTKYSRWIWMILRKGALTVMNQKQESSGVLISYKPVYWPKDSKFHISCQYIVNHYDELTLYLTYPELEWTNNLSERAQRKEKLMLNSSFFRKTREGRVVLDILKTIMATAQAAEINFEDYLQFVVLNKEDVKSNPHLYTPIAFAQRRKPNMKPFPKEESLVSQVAI